MRRVKTYSAESGFVYEYFYEGMRPYRSGGESGTEFVFQISSARRAWRAVSVLAGDAALLAWQSAHGRELSGPERYAIAKMSLLQAFDERAAPEMAARPVRIRPADIEAIAETLGL